ncbi:thioredoxin fold domain-containing protein [Pelagicoccus mobilis]|uniref:Thioredoxin family protein n=1 Tax=Pelagicoccus mobilis TaxID=415221 RepID=A0A934RYX1_9BACT|nr:thioredoxin fold domain-containing protein [Pelagicoccus mobilis]MBK1877829.1 thioredoxin family protein [Pelagicoccus mobilis]
MEWISDIDEALAKRGAEGKRLLAIFKGNGDWCKWCNALDEVLKESDALEKYLESEDILGAKILIARKSEDETGVRERFGITGIPFLVFYSAEGDVEGTTEFIDDGDASSYVKWIESVDSSAF